MMILFLLMSTAQQSTAQVRIHTSDPSAEGVDAHHFPAEEVEVGEDRDPMETTPATNTRIKLLHLKESAMDMVCKTTMRIHATSF